jgi:glycosyltransferase involved in cell wall biosynthesis
MDNQPKGTIMNRLPKVTLLVVVRNEKNYIQQAVESLLTQDYPKELTEVIIVDGMSEDGTKELLTEKLSLWSRKEMNIKLLDNPKQILATGWNIGIKKAIGDIVCRIDAHNEIDQSYISIGISTLIEDKSTVCVGGIEENVGIGFPGCAIANLFTSKFGVGNAKYRTGLEKAEYTDTAKCGVYWKWVFEKHGYFNENLERNQDIDYHSRLIDKGFRFITHPDMKIKYFVRNTIPGLIKKAFGDGYWIIASKKSYLRHKIPLFFVLCLIMFSLVWLIAAPGGYALSVVIVPLCLYVMLDIAFSIRDGKSGNRLLLYALFPVFHVSYGIGSLKAIVDYYFLRKSKY